MGYRILQTDLEKILIEKVNASLLIPRAKNGGLNIELSIPMVLTITRVSLVMVSSDSRSLESAMRVGRS